MSKPILCVDFDGVIHAYTSGWRGPLAITDPITPGFFRWATEAARHFRLLVYSSRSKEAGAVDAMRAWLELEWAQFMRSTIVGAGGLDPEPDEIPPMLPIEFAHEKPAAFLTIDDRAVLFRGDWSAPELQPEAMRAFKPWNKP